MFVRPDENQDIPIFFSRPIETTFRKESKAVREHRPPVSYRMPNPNSAVSSKFSAAFEGNNKYVSALVAGAICLCVVSIVLRFTKSGKKVTFPLWIVSLILTGLLFIPCFYEWIKSWRKRKCNSEVLRIYTVAFLIMLAFTASSLMDLNETISLAVLTMFLAVIIVFSVIIFKTKLYSFMENKICPKTNQPAPSAVE